jgi:ABC-type Fe3+/spermidine/putrescine transport system ATPase subunit
MTVAENIGFGLKWKKEEAKAEIDKCSISSG